MVSSVGPRHTSPVLDALQSSWLARFISESQVMTASLSSFHLLGFTLVMGSGVLCSLRLLGAILPDQPSVAVVRPATRVLLVGLSISLLTGGLLVVPRAYGAAMNPMFRLKMLLLAVGVGVHFVLVRPASRYGSTAVTRRALGAASLMVWLGLAVSASAFILLE